MYKFNMYKIHSTGALKPRRRHLVIELDLTIRSPWFTFAPALYVHVTFLQEGKRPQARGNNKRVN